MPKYQYPHFPEKLTTEWITWYIGGCKGPEPGKPPKREEKMGNTDYAPEKRQTIQGEAIAPRPKPKDVNIITGHKRAGQQLRDRYVLHLHDLHAKGYYKDDEWRARIAAGENAETEADLALLLADLPPLPMPEEKKQAKAATKQARREEMQSIGGRWKAYPALRILTYITLVAVGLTTAFVPMALIVGLHSYVPLGPLFIIPSMIGGWGLAIASVWLCIRDYLATEFTPPKRKKPSELRRERNEARYRY